MAALTKVDLKRLAHTICNLNNEIKNKTQLLDDLKKEIYPFINPGESIQADNGCISKSMKGQTSFGYTTKAAEKAHKAYKELLIERGDAFNKVGDPFLIVERLKDGL